MRRLGLRRWCVRRASSHNAPKARNRILRNEALEPRIVLSGSRLLSLVMDGAATSAMVGAVRVTNTAPTVARLISVNAGGPITSKSATLSVLGMDDGGESNLVYKWSVAASPAGGGATFSLNGSNAAKNTTITFTKLGTYNLSVKITDRSGLSVSNAKAVVVTPALAGVGLSTSYGQAMAKGATLAVSGTSQAVVAQGFDQFGNVMTAPSALTWSMTTIPTGATKPTIVASGAGATVAFGKVGTYGLTVQATTASGTTVSSTVLMAVAARPTSFSVSQIGTAAQVTRTTAQFSASPLLDQFGNPISAYSSLTWMASSIPSGASAPTFVTSGSATTATFRAAGRYVLTATRNDGLGNVLSQSVTVTVVQTASGLTGASTAPVYVSGTRQQLASPSFVDQFGKPMSGSPVLTWSATSLPLNAKAPTFATSGGLTTVTFAMAGSYVLTARVANAPAVSFATTVLVNQTLTSIALSPSVASVLQGATQQFTPQALDQFGQAMVNQQVFAWSATSGTVSASGLFTAPDNVGPCTVTVRSGSVTGTAAVTVLANSGGLQNVTLTQLVRSLDADGSISRADMIQILRSVGGDGVVDAAEFTDLKQLLTQATALNIPEYVRVLAADVINGNQANATFQGQALGNLAAGSSASQLNKLVDKWFLGADHPKLCNTSLVYTNANGSLFAHAPSHADEVQGMLGDCYFISALGTLADSNPAAVRNMFIDNGDGTFTVRFYTGTYGTIYNYSDGSIGAGFKDNHGTADYVTVDRMLPTSTSGMLVYANYGAKSADAGNTLWIALAEKAYAQWNETGKEGRDGLNAYASIQGGWMATVDAQVLGYNATDYLMTKDSTKQVAIDALAARKAVTVGTLQWSGTQYGLYASHAYAIIGYNASSDTFTLYNPWGSDHPGQLTWSQLKQSCSQLAVADTSGTTPMAGAAAILASGKVWSPMDDRLSASLVDASFAAV